MACAKILVVDDEADIVELCVSMLEEEGYQVTGVTHGSEAIRCAQGTSFDVLLADIVMPDPDGLETFREIRKINLNTSGVAMTGRGSMEMAINALNAGFAAFVPKPFNPHQLTQAIREVLEKRRLLQENARLQTMASLYRANQDLMAQTSLRDLAACTVQMALEQSRADSASLMLLEGDCLKIVASEGLPSDITRTACKRLGEPIAGYVAAQGCSLVLDSQDRSSPYASWLTRSHIASALCLPLRSEKQSLGVLNLNRHTPQAPFTRGDADLLHILTMQASLALERLQLAEKRLQEEKLAAIGRVVSNLVHDMRSPLGIIRTSAEMLEGQDRANQPLTHIIIRESDHLMEMAQDVLDFARGEGNLCLEPGLVKDLVEEVVYSLRRQLEPDHVVVIAQVDYGGVLPMDARKMRRALINLATNARDAMPEGGTIRFQVWAEPEAVIFEIADTGCGIPPEYQDRLFEPFFTHGKPNGTGLGLPIVKSIVEGHGGTVTFRSQPGQGTTFTLRLPRQLPTDREGPGAARR